MKTLALCSLSLLVLGFSATALAQNDVVDLRGTVYESESIDQEDAESVFANAEAAVWFPDLQRVRWIAVTEPPASFSARKVAALSAPNAVTQFRAGVEADYPDFAKSAWGPFLLKVPATRLPLADDASVQSVPRGTATLFTDSFENGLSQWQLANDSGGAFNFTTMGCKSHTGAWSADAVRGGTTGQYSFCWTTYPASVTTQLTHASCEGVSGASQAWLDFWLTAEMDDSETIGAYYLGSDGYLWGYEFIGNWSNWYHIVLNLKQWVEIGDVTARPCPKTIFQFRSDAAATAGAGVWIDDVTVRTDAPPFLRCSISASPASGGVPLKVNFTADVSGASGNESYEWRFGGASSSISTAKNPSFTYTAAGDYQVRLRVVDTNNTRGYAHAIVHATAGGTTSGTTRRRAVARPNPPSDTTTVQPSPAAQTFSSGDVTVTIPGGLLTAPTPLRVAKLASAPPPNFKGQGLGAAYEVTLGTLHALSQPIIIRLRYDASKLRSDLELKRAMTAAWYDETSSVWVEVPMNVDQAKQELVIGTNHLSKYGWFMWLSGYEVIDSTHFTVVYDKKELNDPILGPVYNAPDVSHHVDASVPDYIEDAVAYLENAYARYKSAGFKQPSTPINVYVGGSDPSQRAKFFGHGLTISLNSMTQAQLKLDTGHELFHSFEGAYLTAVGMGTGELPLIGWAPPILSWSVWYIESAADYAAEWVAWDGALHLMGGRIRRDYLSYALSDVSINHDYGYSTAHFIKYLVGRGANFKALSEYLFNYDWMNANDYYFPMHEYLQKTITGGGLPRQYQEFARYFVMDAGSPMPALEDSLHSEVAAYRSSLTGNPQESVTVDLAGGYSAKLWGVALSDSLFDATTPKVKYTVSVDGTLPSKVEIDVYVLKGDKRISGGGSPVGTLTQLTKAVLVEAEKGDVIYVLAVNTDSTRQQVKIRIAGDLFARLSLGNTEYTFLCMPGKDCSGEWCGMKQDEGPTWKGPLTWSGNKFEFTAPGLRARGELSADGKTLLSFTYDWLEGNRTIVAWRNLPLDKARSNDDQWVFAASGEDARDRIVTADPLFCENNHAGVDFSKKVLIEVWLGR